MPRWLADRRDQLKVENMAVSHLFECKSAARTRDQQGPKWANIPFVVKRLQRGIFLVRGTFALLWCE